MDDGLKKLLELAWAQVPATEANEAIARARRATAAAEAAAELPAEQREAIFRGEAADPSDSAPDAPMARAYELLLAPEATLETFARDQLPRLVYHLESLGAHLPRAAGVVVCVFADGQLHFLQAGELIAGLCGALGTTPEELSRRYGTGELRTAIRSGQAAPPRAPEHADELKKGPPLGLPPPGAK